MLYTMLLAATISGETLPKTNDPTLQNIFKKKLTFYNHPRAYQHAGGVHNAYHNISALGPDAIGNRTDKPVEPFGNPNRELPWGHSGGTHRCDGNLVIKKFHNIPGKISYYNTQVRMVNHFPPHEDVVEWIFPDNTIFGEVFYIKDNKDILWPFEVRIRQKVNNKWIPNVYRPITSREEYDSLFMFPDKPNVNVESLKGHTFNSKAAIDTLPAIPEKRVKEFLSRPFKSVKGKAWITYEGVEGYAPTTKEDFHIVPKNYDAGFIEVSQKSCMRCHEDTLKSVTEFNETRDISKSVDWYGTVRGSDGILSYHIFDKSCISSNGFTLPIKYRKTK